MKKTELGPVNLAEMSFFQVKQLSKAISGMPSRQIAEKMGMGHEHISRHFREADYNLSPASIPDLCKVLGNDLQIQWQCAQVGGHLAKIDISDIVDSNPDVCIARTCQEFSHVLEENAIAMLDGARSAEEISLLDAHLQHVVRAAEDARLSLKAARSQGKA